MTRYLQLEGIASEEKKALARNIKKRRKALGLSQAELSARANVAASHLSLMERVKANPTLAVLV